MADNTVLNAGSGGDTVATDDIGGVKHQQVKVEFGADGVATMVSSSNPLPSSLILPDDGTQNMPFSRYLSDDGSSTGAKEAAADFSLASGYRYLQPAGANVMRVASLSVAIVAPGIMDADDFGHIAGPLASGINIGVGHTPPLPGVSLLAINDGLLIKQNSDFAALCRTTPQVMAWGAGSVQVLLAVIDFKNMFGQYLRLDGAANEFLYVQLNDDLSTLDSLLFHAAGYTEATAT